MERLSNADLTALLSASRDLLAYHTLDAFPVAVVRAVGRLVPGIRHSYINVDLRRKRTIALIVDPPDAMPPGLDKTAARCAHEHPLVIHRRAMRDGRAHMLSDFATRREFTRTSTYAEVYRPINAFDQLGFELLSPDGTMVGIGVNRGQVPFTERDRTVLDLLRPHIVEAYRAARVGTTMQAALDASERAIMTVDAHGHTGVTTQRAHDLLGAYCPRATGSDALPDMLADWLRHGVGQEQVSGDTPSAPMPLVITGEKGRLVIRLVTVNGGNGHLLLLHEEQAMPSAAMLAQLGLSPRECDVLYLVMQGKADKEISPLLGCATNTVRKHLEHIYAKLNVRGRTAAVSRIFAVCREGDFHTAPRRQ